MGNKALMEEAADRLRRRLDEAADSRADELAEAVRGAADGDALDCDEAARMLRSED